MSLARRYTDATTRRFLRPGLVALVMALSTGCSEEAPVRENPVSGLRIDTVLGTEGDAGFAKATGPVAFVFPSDHGPHPDYRSEWWYLTAALKDEAGNDYGLHYTLFRQALAPAPTGDGPWQTAQAYLAHLAVTDVAQGIHLETERFARGHPDLAGVTVGDGFSAVIEDWTLQGDASDKLELNLQASEVETFSVDLNISQVLPAVLQGERGYSEKGPGSASYYYSMPHLLIDGVLQLNDRSVSVSGLGWLDREWSTSVLGKHLVGWDWFALQLDDGRSLMAFQLRRQDGERDSYDHGLLVDHNALPPVAVADHETPGVTLLKAGSFKLKPTRFYEDVHGISWPVSWRLSLGDEEMTVEAMLDDQRMDLSIVYWEGLVEVRDSQGESIGRGYMELTGYSAD